MKGLNLSTFKKVAEDKHSATMRHDDGHTLIISKGSLPALHRKQLEKLPMYADGGTVTKQTTSDKQTLGQKIGYPGYAEGGDVAPPENASFATSLKDPRDLNLDQAVAQEQAGNAPVGTGGTPWYGTPAPAAPQSDMVSSSQSAVAPAELHTSATTQPAPQPNTQPPLAQTPMQAQAAAFKAEQEANLAGASAVGAQGQAESAAIKDTAAQVAALPTQAELVQANKKASDDLYQAYASKQIDPNHYWHELGTGGQIASSIGMILSGIGSGITGGPNLALQVMDRAISRDIEAQKASQDQKMTLWKMNREALGNDLAANLATQNQLYTGLKYKIEQAAANAKGPIAKAQAMAANAHIQQALDLNNFKLGLMNPSSDNPDPASRVQFLVSDPATQKVVNEEIAGAENMVHNFKGIDEAFWQAAKDARPLSGGLETSTKAFIPGMKTPGQQAFQARIAPTITVTEGTGRKTAFDNVDNNMTPAFGDSDAAIRTKYRSFIDYARSKSATTNSKSHGIDLTRFHMSDTSRLGEERLRQLGEEESRPAQPATSKSGRPIVYVNGKAFYK